MSAAPSLFHQKTITLASRPRGFHLITDDVVRQLPELRTIAAGLAHFFLQHTSASLAINENADPDVRADLDSHLDRLVPESERFRHTTEGPDDMPSHIKSVLLGVSLSIPVRQGRLALGTWQGLYLCEHRHQGGARHLVVTLTGQSE